MESRCNRRVSRSIYRFLWQGQKQSKEIRKELDYQKWKWGRNNSSLPYFLLNLFTFQKCFPCWKAEKKCCHNTTARLPKPSHAGIIQVSNNITTTQTRIKQDSWKLHFLYADNFDMSLFSCTIKLMNHVNHNVNNSATSLIRPC